MFHDFLTGLHLNIKRKRRTIAVMACVKMTNHNINFRGRVVPINRSRETANEIRPQAIDKIGKG
jgi:hypothetical protein